MTSIVNSSPPTVEPDPLKGGDVYKWALEQSAHILAGRFDKIDIVNVADEIESVAKTEFRSLASNVEIVLAHILKWDYQPNKRSRSRYLSILEHRDRIEQDLSDSPSLTARIDDAVDRGYRVARYVAERDTGLSRTCFPIACPYDWNAIMTRSFVLDQTDEAS